MELPIYSSLIDDFVKFGYNEQMDRKIIKARLAKIRLAMKQAKIDCLIASSKANVRYATCFDGAGSWAIITKRSSYLITDSRYTTQAKAICQCCKIVQRTDSLAQAAGKIIKKSATIKTIAVEPFMSIADHKNLKKQLRYFSIKPTLTIIEQARIIKSPDEIANIKKAAEIANISLKKTLLNYAKNKITEAELAARLDFSMRSLSATVAFETIVAFGENAARPHHLPTDRKLKKNDTILIDFGANYNGYCCDITRCFAIGKISALYRKIYDTVLSAQLAAIEKVGPGKSIAEADAAARNIIKKAGFDVYGHSTGHGIGLVVHESPTVYKTNKQTFSAGQVLTIEPGIYLPNSTGVRIEDDILVTDCGCEILTKNCSKTLINI